MKCGVAGGGDTSPRSFRACPQADLSGHEAAWGSWWWVCFPVLGFLCVGPPRASFLSPCPPACSGPARGLSRKCPVPGFGMDVGGQVMAQWPPGHRPFSKEEERWTLENTLGLFAGPSWAAVLSWRFLRSRAAKPAEWVHAAQIPDGWEVPVQAAPLVTPGVQRLCFTGACELGRGAAYSECSSSISEGPGVRIPTGHTASAGAGGS